MFRALLDCLSTLDRRRHEIAQFSSEKGHGINIFLKKNDKKTLKILPYFELVIVESSLFL
jgi:hypothetical protein